MDAVVVRYLRVVLSLPFVHPSYAFHIPIPLHPKTNPMLLHYVFAALTFLHLTHLLLSFLIYCTLCQAAVLRLLEERRGLHRLMDLTRSARCPVCRVFPRIWAALSPLQSSGGCYRGGNHYCQYCSTGSVSSLCFTVMYPVR